MKIFTTYIILEILKLLAPIGKRELKKVLKDLTSWRPQEIERKVSILQALNFFEIISNETGKEEYLVPVFPHNQNLMNKWGSGGHIKARAQILRLYERYNSPMLEEFYEHYITS